MPVISFRKVTKMPMNVAEAKEMLLKWAKAKTKEYDVSIRFGTSNPILVQLRHSSRRVEWGEGPVMKRTTETAGGPC